MNPMFLQIRNAIVLLWNFGTGTARLVIRLAILVIVFGVVVPLLVWPFVILYVSFAGWISGNVWFTAVVALVPFAVFVVFVVAAGTILVLAYPLISGVLLATPQVRSALDKFLLAVFVAVFGELVLGLYLSVFQVWNWPVLIPVLVLLVVVLGMWLFFKRRFGWRRTGWFTTMLVFSIVAISLLFVGASAWRFVSQRYETVAQAAVSAASPETVQEFTLNAGELKDTVLVGAGSWYRIQSNKPWNATCAQPGEPFGVCQMPAGPSSWQVRKEETREGLLQAIGVEDGTVIRFEKVR